MIQTAAAIATALVVASGPASTHSGEFDPSANLQTTACTLPAGWSAVAKRHPRYVVFGEIHGTQQSPAFVARVACALAMRKRQVLVALELNATDNDAMQAAWRLPHDSFADALLKIGWADRTDGVGSQAMFDMLVTLHRLKDRGQPIAIVAFNGMRDAAQRVRFSALPGQGPHEAAQAENIRNAAKSHPTAQVLVLVGNLHARKEPVDRGGVLWKPMAMQLAPAAEVLSLNMQTAGGSTWNCQLRRSAATAPGKPIDSADMECGSHPYRAKTDLQKPSFVALSPFPGEENDAKYDGFFWLGPVLASPPAVAAP